MVARVVAVDVAAVTAAVAAVTTSAWRRLWCTPVSEAPKPRKSTVVTRNPAPNRAGNTGSQSCDEVG